MSRRSNSDSGKKRDSLLKRSIANASKSAMTNDVVVENKMGEKWMNMEMPDDSINDLMKQELVLVDSDLSLNSSFEAELNIPMLKELTESKKKESTPESENDGKMEGTITNETHTSIIDREIAKLNEIKMAKTREDNLEDTMSKLKEMVSKVDTNGNGEASQLLEQLCVVLNKKSNKNTLEPPPVMIRQGTFNIDKTEENVSIDTSNNSDSGSPQLQAVIEKLSEVLGNVNMNVIQSSPDDPQNTNPVVVVVVNPERGYAMSDTVTISHHHNYNTPQPKPRTRRSQSFSNACRPNTAAPVPARRDSIAHGTPQRTVQPTRRSFSFGSPAPSKPIASKRSSILPSVSQKHVTPLKAAQTAPSALLAKPAPSTANRLSFMDKLKPKIGFSSTSQKKPANKSVPLKVTGPLKVVHREKSPTALRQTPMAQSNPMSSIATPQKPTRVSFLTPNRPTTSASTLTVPKSNTGANSNINRRSSFNDKADKTSANPNLKPKPSLIRPNTGGLLTQRKFPGGLPMSGSRPTVPQKTFTAKPRK